MTNFTILISCSTVLTHWEVLSKNAYSWWLPQYCPPLWELHPTIGSFVWFWRTSLSSFIFVCELNVNWSRAYSWAALFITKHLRNVLALTDLTAQVCLRAKNPGLTLHRLNCSGFKPPPSTAFQSTANPCLLQDSPVELLSCAWIAPFSVSYTVIVSHVLMRLNEAFAAKIGIKRSGGILIEMNQQAPLCFLIHFSRKKKKMPAIMSWSCPSDHSTHARGSSWLKRWWRSEMKDGSSNELGLIMHFST